MDTAIPVFESNSQEPPSFEPLKVAGTPFFTLFDGLLRRRETYFNAIFENREVGALIRWCLLATLALGATYGLAMGALSLHTGLVPGLLQSLSSACKVPLLFLLSLFVCYPVLYFVIVLMGSRLSFSQTLALIMLAVTMNCVLLAGCAPIVLFFSFTSSSTEFVKLLHVAVFTFSGAWAMQSLWDGLVSMCEKSDLYPKQAMRILRIWCVVFGFVGVQMAWSLRPFVGSEDSAFRLFHHEGAANLYQAAGGWLMQVLRF